MGASARLFADDHLRKLARYLRALGVDVAWERGIADDELRLRAAREGRIVLTCDRRLAEEAGPGRGYHVKAREIGEQLREVTSAIPGLLEGARPFSRCLVCNVKIVPLPKDEAARLVPPRALEAHEEFFRCPTCGRAFWEGSHVAALRRVLESSVLLG